MTVTQLNYWWLQKHEAVTKMALLIQINAKCQIEPKLFIDKLNERPDYEDYFKFYFEVAVVRNCTRAAMIEKKDFYHWKSTHSFVMKKKENCFTSAKKSGVVFKICPLYLNFEFFGFQSKCKFQ